MDITTRIGAPRSLPSNPDSFEHFNAHATRLLDFHRPAPTHAGFFKFPVAQSPWSVLTRVSHDRDEDSDDKHSLAVAAAAAVGNPVPPTPPQKLHFSWGLEYFNEQPAAPAAGATATAAAPAKAKTCANRNGVKPRVLRGDSGTIFKGSVENDGTLDLAIEHRISRNFSFKSYGLYYDAPNQSLVGMNMRLDGSSWNADVKLNTDGGVGGMTAAYQPINGTVVGCEAFYIRAEKGPIYAFGVKQNLPLARWLKPSTFSFTATSLGALTGLYSAPISHKKLSVATRFTYDLAMFESSWSVGAEVWPVRLLLGAAGKGGAAKPAAAAAAAAGATAATPASATPTAAASAAAPSEGSTTASMLRDTKLQAMVDPHNRYAVALSMPVTPQFYVSGSVSKRWTSTSTELPTLALSFVYE